MLIQFFTHLLFSLILNASVPSQITSWETAPKEKNPLQACLFLNAKKDHRICIVNLAEKTQSKLQLIEFKNGNQKRRLLSLIDTSNSCEGKSLGAATFYGFEQKDADGDGNMDAVILINSGKEKRKPTDAEPCPHPKIRTGIYELVYLNRPDGAELYPPSELVVERFRSFNVLDD